MPRFTPQILPLLKATDDMREPLTAYLRQISDKYKKLVIVHDIGNSATVRDVASIPNAESYALTCSSALTMAAYFTDCANQFPELQELPGIRETLSDVVLNYANKQVEALEHRSGYIYNTCRTIEGPYLDIVERQLGKRCWAVGPTAPINIKPDAKKWHKCLEWLDQHDANSVIYVSFGTTVTLLDQELKELAEGLESCNAKFLWVLQDCDKPNIFDGETRRVELPEGFEERTKGVGIVVRDWVPQPEILAHPSIGGFFSHCGWNSCMESFGAGVPMATWPMHADQPFNLLIVTKVLKIGLVVREWNTKLETARASTIASVLKKLMASDEMRNRAKELGVNVRKATQPGGESQLELDSFIAHITR